MHRKGWYLVVYDIAGPRRLMNIHRFLKREGIAVQKSVFLVHGTEEKLIILLNKLDKMIVPHEDDLRAYPIQNPNRLWIVGIKPNIEFPFLSFDEESTP